MKIGLIAGAAAAGALIAGTTHAATFADYVNVLVPGQAAVTFQSFDDTTSPEMFTGLTVPPTNFTSGTVILTEPDGKYSDLLTLLVDAHGGLTILFFSDPSIAPPIDILPNPLTLVETGGVQDVSSFFGGVALVQVGSDLNVPEPAAWTMMLIGLGMAGGALRARRRTAATAV